jgi:hypothetical protein
LRVHGVDAVEIDHRLATALVSGDLALAYQIVTPGMTEPVVGARLAPSRAA